MDSQDSLLKAQATRYMLDMVAERCETPQDLYEILAAISDPEQRFMVLDGVKPLLKFSTEGLDFHDEAETIN